MPESPESRLLRLERDTARLGQRVEDLAADVADLNPLAIGQARLEGAIDGIKQTNQAIQVDVAELKAGLANRDRQATDERRSMRVALIGLTAVIGAALIGAAATVLTVIL